MTIEELNSRYVELKDSLLELKPQLELNASNMQKRRTEIEKLNLRIENIKLNSNYIVIDENELSAFEKQLEEKKREFNLELKMKNSLETRIDNIDVEMNDIISSFAADPVINAQMQIRLAEEYDLKIDETKQAKLDEQTRIYQLKKLIDDFKSDSENNQELNELVSCIDEIKKMDPNSKAYKDSNAKYYKEIKEILSQLGYIGRLTKDDMRLSNALTMDFTDFINEIQREIDSTIEGYDNEIAVLIDEKEKSLSRLVDLSKAEIKEVDSRLLNEEYGMSEEEIACLTMEDIQKEKEEISEVYINKEAFEKMMNNDSELASLFEQYKELERATRVSLHNFQSNPTIENRRNYTENVKKIVKLNTCFIEHGIKPEALHNYLIQYLQENNELDSEYDKNLFSNKMINLRNNCKRNDIELVDEISYYGTELERFLDSIYRGKYCVNVDKFDEDGKKYSKEVDVFNETSNKLDYYSEFFYDGYGENCFNESDIDRYLDLISNQKQLNPVKSKFSFGKFFKKLFRKNKEFLSSEYEEVSCDMDKCEENLRKIKAKEDYVSGKDVTSDKFSGKFSDIDRQHYSHYKSVASDLSKAVIENVKGEQSDKDEER